MFNDVYKLLAAEEVRLWLKGTYVFVLHLFDHCFALADAYLDASTIDICSSELCETNRLSFVHADDWTVLDAFFHLDQIHRIIPSMYPCLVFSCQ